MASEVGPKAYLKIWRSHQAGAFVAETVEVARWDLLLGKLGLTEREALDAIARDGEAGRSIRRFVHDSCRDHFVPEDVLHAVKLQRSMTFESSSQ